VVTEEISERESSRATNGASFQKTSSVVSETHLFVNVTDNNVNGLGMVNLVTIQIAKFPSYDEPIIRKDWDLF
jgi:hypothetical protein